MQPSDQVYTDLVNIVMNTEFFQGGGWNRSKIGWFWGGMTVQGVLPYYYNRIATPGRSQIVDRCFYNTMADTDPCRLEVLLSFFLQCVYMYLFLEHVVLSVSKKNILLFGYYTENFRF